jgi:hypothetical protein
MADMTELLVQARNTFELIEGGHYSIVGVAEKALSIAITFISL